MISRVNEEIERVGVVAWLACLLRRVEASVVYVGGPSVSGLGLACSRSRTATACHSPQKFDSEYKPFRSLVLKQTRCLREGIRTV
jgi:hypothetical protein